MSRPVLWALSPLPPGGLTLPTGVLRARCGELLARVVVTCQQPPGPVCPYCAVIYLVEFEGPRFGRQPAGPPYTRPAVG